MAELGDLLGASEAELRANSGINNYSIRPDANKAGKLIREPRQRLKRVHSRVHEVLKLLPTPDYLHSTTGRSPISNARAHLSGDYLAKMDIRSFFESSQREHVFRFFRYRLEMRDAVAWLLTDVLTLDGELPRGAPHSTLLSFWAYRPMFDEISELAESKKLKFTLYVDDLTFSGSYQFAGKLFVHVRAISKKYGLNLKKSKFVQYGKHQTKFVTGCAIVNHELRIPNSTSSGIVDALKSVHQTKRINKTKVNSLKSKISWARQIEPGVFQTTFDQLKAAGKKLGRQAANPVK